MSSNEYQQNYWNSLKGRNNQNFAFIISTQIHKQFNATFNLSLITMKGESVSKDLAFCMEKNHFMLGHFNYIINRFKPAGIPKYFADIGLWFLFKNLENEIKDPRKILSLTDLEFGFVLFLAAAGVSILVFFGELLWQQLWLKLRRKLKILIGIWEMLRVLRERMRDYHDGW
jgi:hypothetical protein